MGVKMYKLKQQIEMMNIKYQDHKIRINTVLHIFLNEKIYLQL